MAPGKSIIVLCFSMLLVPAASALKLQSSASQRPHEFKQVLQYGWPAEELGTKGKDEAGCGQGWLVSSLLGCKKDGYYIDLGAATATNGSNTLMLERDFNWQGICFEANPASWDGLKKRRCNLVEAAIGSPTDTQVTMSLELGHDGGIVCPTCDTTQVQAGRTELRTIALADILQKLGAPSTIDFFSLDVEGAESMIVDGFPWDKYRFTVLMVERPKPDLRKTLQSHGYHYLRQNCNCGMGFGDQTWIHESMPGLQHVLETFKNGAKPPTCMEKNGSPWPTRGVSSKWGLAVEDDYSGTEFERADDAGKHNTDYDTICKKPAQQ